jgi:hypothetical protein
MPAATPPNDLPDHLQLLAGSLIEAAMVLRAIDGPETARLERERVASTLDGIRQGLPAVANGLRGRHAPSPTAASALLTWRHTLRESMTVILGWVHLLAQDPSRQVAAMAQIERAGWSLREVLGRPPD